jgi:hypothetical protein
MEAWKAGIAQAQNWIAVLSKEMMAHEENAMAGVTDIPEVVRLTST